MKENKLSILVQFIIGNFLLTEYYYHVLPITNIKRVDNVNIHYNSAHVNNFKSKTKIRSFNRNSKVNFI